MIKIKRIHITIIVLLAYILLAPHVPFLFDNLIVNSVVILVLLGLWALKEKHTVDTILTLGIALIYLLARLGSSETAESVVALRTSSLLSFTLLNFVLLIGPWSRWNSFFLRMYFHRRHFGVTVFFLGLFHASIIMTTYFSSELPRAFSAVFTYFGFTPLFIMTLMAATSWDYVQKHVSFALWRLIHLSALTVYLLFFYYFYTISASQLRQPHWIMLFVIIGFWIVIAPWREPRTNNYIAWGWKRLHLLIYVAYASLILHSWEAFFSFSPAFIKYPYIALISFTAGSHVTGLVMLVCEKFTKTSSKKIIKNGTAYFRLDTLNSFVPGIGRRFDISGTSVAAFLYGNKIIAYSNVCAHQGGPIYKGSIVNGYVECPWHKWQYSVTDGCGPPGFKDCIPFYETHIEDGVVYTTLSNTKKLSSGGR